MEQNKKNKKNIASLGHWVHYSTSGLVYLMPTTKYIKACYPEST